MIGDIACYHCSRTHESIATDSCAADDGGIGPKAGSFFYACGARFIHAANIGTGVEHIGEHHTWAAKNIIFQCYTFIYTDIVLNFAPISHFRIWAYDDILANIAIFPDD